MKQLIRTIAGAVTILLLGSALPARAADWSFDLFVYGLGASMDGTVGIGSSDAEVDVGFDDVLGNLELGGMVAFRAKSERWAIVVDAIFMGLGAASELVDVDVDQLVLEVDGAYRLSPIFELLFGARLIDIEAEADFLGPQATRLRGGDSWVDPVVGFRAEAPLGAKWLIVGRLDVGGFGVGSDFAWNAVLDFGYRLGDRAILAFGWRTLDIDFDDGEGFDRFAYDVQSSGPVLGIVFRF